MRFRRACGTLVHPTSFPSDYGMGDFGKGARKFIDFLKTTGQTVWQILPLTPVGYGDSPYTSYSAFAGNHYLISPDTLEEKGLLTSSELLEARLPSTTKAQFSQAYAHKERLFRLASQRYFEDHSPASRALFEQFQNSNKYWLEEYTVFMASLKVNGWKSWNEWPTGLAHRNRRLLEDFKREHREEIRYQTWLQYEFAAQWSSLKSYANERDIQIIGDIPIFVNHNSADVWSRPELFEVGSDGKPKLVSGVPPDYFSETGQLWGNPLFNWKKMEENGFSWWIERFRQMFRLFDATRIDHFRGFEAYWEVPASEKNAINGKWVKGPGEKLFITIQKELGRLPVIAEDLGVITPAVDKLRDRFSFPGMKVLQFAFGSDSGNPYLPHHYPRNCVVYTGTHDNDTTLGWYQSAPTADAHRARVYTRSDGSEINWELIRLAMLSTADLAIFPMQDFMNLGQEHRMNIPGTAENNWTWRYTDEMLERTDHGRIRFLSELSARIPNPKKRQSD